MISDSKMKEDFQGIFNPIKTDQVRGGSRAPLGWEGDS